MPRIRLTGRGFYGGAWPNRASHGAVVRKRAPSTPIAGTGLNMGMSRIGEFDLIARLVETVADARRDASLRVGGPDRRRERR